MTGRGPVLIHYPIIDEKFIQTAKDKNIYGLPGSALKQYFINNAWLHIEITAMSNKLSLTEVFRRIIAACSGKYQTLEDLYQTVNDKVVGRRRWSVASLSAVRRYPMINYLIDTCYFEGDKRGWYIAKPNAIAELERRLDAVKNRSEGYKKYVK